MNDEQLKELQWGFAIVTGHTCKICGKQILSPLRVDVVSEISAWYSFHIRCANKFCKKHNIDMCCEFKEVTP